MDSLALKLSALTVATSDWAEIKHVRTFVQRLQAAFENVLDIHDGAILYQRHGFLLKEDPGRRAFSGLGGN